MDTQFDKITMIANGTAINQTEVYDLTRATNEWRTFTEKLTGHLQVLVKSINEFNAAAAEWVMEEDPTATAAKSAMQGPAERIDTIVADLREIGLNITTLRESMESRDLHEIEY